MITESKEAETTHLKERGLKRFAIKGSMITAAKIEANLTKGSISQ